MNGKRKTIYIALLLLGVIILAGGLFWSTNRDKPVSAPIFSNQTSIGVWGPVRLSLPLMDGRVPEYSFEISPDLPYTEIQKANQIELKFTFPADPETDYTLRLTPDENSGNLTDFIEWKFTPRKPEVIYMVQQQDGADLWVVKAETGEKRQLTFTNGNIQYYSPDPDGESVVFSVSNNQAGADIWSIDRSGENMKQLVECGSNTCSVPSFSPSGEGFAYIKLERQTGKDPISQILLYNDNLTKSSILYEQTGRLVSDLNWSPDGKILAFVDENGPNIKFYRIETKNVSTVSCPASETGGWSPDGSRMIFACSESGEENPCKDLKEINPVTMEMSLSPMFDIMKQRDYSPPAWSPDGKWIVFGERCFSDRPTRQLWLVDASAYHGAQITDDEMFNFANYSWDPASSMLVMQRFEMGSATAAPYIMLWRLATEDLEMLAEGGHSPNWLP